MIQDAEAFAQKHTAKFSVSYANKQTDDSKQKAQKKNVSFIENPNYSVNIASSNDEDDFNQHKSILKSARAASQSPTRSSKPSDPITSRSTIGFNFNESSNQDVANDLLVTANASKKSKLEGYEILVSLTWFNFVSFRFRDIFFDILDDQSEAKAKSRPNPFQASNFRWYRLDYEECSYYNPRRVHEKIPVGASSLSDQLQLDRGQEKLDSSLAWAKPYFFIFLYLKQPKILVPYLLIPIDIYFYTFF